MAYKITDFVRFVAVSADYPRGDIKDNPAGTLVNRTMMTDIVQLFSKIMADAGITPNSLPDNVTNGYQLKDALDLRNQFTNTGISFATVAVPWQDGVGAYPVGYKVAGNEVSLCGVAANPGGMPGGSVDIMTLPAEARPTTAVKILTWVTTSGPSGTAVAQLNIATSGVVSCSIAGGTSASVTLDGLRYRKS